MISDLAIQIVLDAVQVVVAIVMSAGALYSGMNILDRLTPGIDEWKEIKKGNLALGILFTAVMVSLIILLEPRILDFIANIRIDLDPILTLKLLLITFVNYVIGLLVGTLIVFLTLHVIDRITPDLDEMSELKKGNLAVALVYSVALILVIFAVSAPIQNGFSMLIQIETLLL